MKQKRARIFYVNIHGLPFYKRAGEPSVTFCEGGAGAEVVKLLFCKEKTVNREAHRDVVGENGFEPLKS